MNGDNRPYGHAIGRIETVGDDALIVPKAEKLSSISTAELSTKIVYFVKIFCNSNDK